MQPSYTQPSGIHSDGTTKARRILSRAGVLFVVSLLGAGPAFAAGTTRNDPGSSATVQQRRITHAPPAPRRPTLFGLPIRVHAPVPAPYANSAMRTYGGQPESSGDAAVLGTGR